MITLSNFEQSPCEGGVEVSCKADISGEVEHIAFQIRCDDDLAATLAPKPEAFLIAMLLPAMERGEDIHVDGPLDAEFLHRVNKYAISILATKLGDLTEIAVTSQSQLARRPDDGGRGALTGMSCGVDSLRTMMVYGPEGQNLPEKYRLKYLGVYDVGAFYDSALQYPRALEKAQRVADQSGCRLFGVSADFGKLYQTSFPMSCTMRHVACSLCLTDFVSAYLVSSAYPWDVIGVDPRAPTAMEALDPVLLPMLSSPQLEMFSACADEMRDYKVENIISSSPFLSEIDVCTRPTDKRDVHKNCGTCQKCADFLILSEYLGVLEKVAPYFNMESYRRRKYRIFQRIFTAQVVNKNRFPGFFRDEVKERNVPRPFGAIFLGKAYGYCLVLLDWLRIRKLF